MLDATGLWATYGPIPAVRGVDVHVHTGDVLAVLGRNGAGKTTLLSVLAGLKMPTRGRVYVDEQDVTAEDAYVRVRRGVVLVPEGRGLFPTLSVRDNLRAGAFTRRMGARTLEDSMMEATEWFPKLRQRMGQQAGTLSGGEAQMLVIARALMSKPRLLLLDEPSLGLAPIAVDEVYEGLAGMRAMGLTVVVVEQYAQVAMQLADEVMVMDKGEAVLAGGPDEIRDTSELDRIYLAQ